MPRPSRNLVRTSVYLPTADLAKLDTEALQAGSTRSELLRLAVEHYLRRDDDVALASVVRKLAEDPWNVWFYGEDDLHPEGHVPTHLGVDTSAELTEDEARAVQRVRPTRRGKTGFHIE